MIGPSLTQIEREVEAARAKLASDLQILRSPETVAELTEALKQEAIDAKDALLDKAKTSVQSSIESLIQDVKARAAANPAAALTIGAGIAWQLLRHPPIATALVGAGLLSLFRTKPALLDGRAPDYLTQAKTRLIEQASEVTEAAKENVAALSKTVAEKVTETAGEIKDRVQDLAGQAALSARKVATETREQATAIWSDTKDAVDQAGHSARSATSTSVSRASATLEEWQHGTRAAVNDAEVRDKLLLGAAGLAVITALGIASQRRIAEQSEAN
jgi:hypothetical protein